MISHELNDSLIRANQITEALFGLRMDIEQKEGGKVAGPGTRPYLLSPDVLHDLNVDQIKALEKSLVDELNRHNEVIRTWARILQAEAERMRGRR